MITYDVHRARRAVQYLVNSSYAHHHIKKLRNTVERPRSLPFKEAAEALNELLRIGRQNHQAMENLIAVAEYKRGGKNDYQREYMAAKRKRDRKVWQLEELMTGKELSPAARKTVLERQYRVWNKERDKLLKSNEGKPWLERNEAIRNFWERKEQEIDALTQEARKNGLTKRRRTR